VKITLRDYQEKAFLDLRKSFASHHRAPFLVAPTGAGKTIIFCAIAEAAAKRGKNIWILVHRQELLRQTDEHLWKIGVHHGCIASGRSMGVEKIQVASVQTLVRRLGKILVPPDIIIVDEGHHSAAASWVKILTRFPKAFLIGCSATPCRRDGKGLGVQSGGFYDDMVTTPSELELMAMGHLSKARVYDVDGGQMDTSKLHIKYGDFVKAEIAERMDTPRVIGDEVSTWRRVCDGVPTIAFCTTVKHAKHVRQAYQDAGVSAESLDGTMSDGMRKSRISGLGSGRFKVLTSCEIVNEGTDIPTVTCAQLLRPTKSLGLHKQQIGRVLRPHPDKKYAVILDHVSNCRRLMCYPATQIKWTLDGDQMKKERILGDEADIAMRRCPKCRLVHNPPKPACPFCGYVFIGKEDILQVPGELIEIDQAVVDAEIAARKEEATLKRRALGQCKTMPELCAKMVEQGYTNKFKNESRARIIMNARAAKKARAA